MLRAIEFKDKRFRAKEDYNLFSPISENAIILCNNYKLMDSLAKEILNTINGKAEYNSYDCDDEDVGNGKMLLAFGLQRVIGINSQRITLALEPSIIYKANDIEDIWLFDQKENNNLGVCRYEGFIYPVCIFKGSREVWNNGKDEMYKVICGGRYGTYDGKWIDSHGKEEILSILQDLKNLKKCYNGDENAIMKPMSFEAYIQEIIDNLENSIAIND